MTPDRLASSRAQHPPYPPCDTGTASKLQNDPNAYNRSACRSTNPRSAPEPGRLKASLIDLWQQWHEDLRAHRGDWTLPGFRAVAICRFGKWRMGIRNKIVRAPFSVLYRWLFRYCRNRYGIELPYCVDIGRRVVIEHQGAIVIHGNSVIGDDTVLRQGVTLGNRHLDQPLEAPVLGQRVNVGAGAKILGNVKIGDDAVIGANSVVLHDVPAGATVVGVPAKPIGAVP